MLFTSRCEEEEMECRECWWASPDKKRFDGVVIDKTSKVRRLLILEFKRRTHTREEYWRKGMQEAREQYEDLGQGIR